MKKTLLLTLSALTALCGFAQESEAPTPDGPTYTLTLKRTDVEPTEATYTLTKSYERGNRFGDVYSVSVPIDVVGANKPAKYAFTLKCQYTNTTGEEKSLTATWNFNLTSIDEPFTMTIGALVYDANATKPALRFCTSNSLYGVADTKTRALCVFDPQKNGEKVSTYLNIPIDNGECKPISKLNNNVETDFLFFTTTGSNVFDSSKGFKSGIYKASLDYATTMLSIEPATTMDITIGDSEVETFVCPADIELPENLKAYTLSYDVENPNIAQATLIQGNAVAANTPVVLKAASGTYTANITSKPTYSTVSDNNDGKHPLYIPDLKSEGNPLVGVLQMHYVPTDSYYLNGAEFTKYTALDENEKENPKVRINPFKSYIALPEATETPASLSIEFPNDETTGIENVYVENRGSEQAYNLFGQPVGDSYKGIVVVKGRKFIRK